MHLLKGPTRTYTLNHYTQGMFYDQVVELMKREYDSDSRQPHFQYTLECINLDAFMSTRSLTTHADGLSKLVEYFELLTPQYPPAFRSDENKIGLP